MTFNEISNHARSIYLLATHAELTAEGYWKDGSEYIPPSYGKDYGEGKSPTAFAGDIFIKHGDLLNVFNDFAAMPDPADFAAPITQLEDICRVLSVDQYVDPETNEAFAGNGIRGEISYLEKNLVSWTGRAAETFNENYLSKLPDRASSQWALAYTLLCTLRAERELWQATQKDVDQIAHDTINALLKGYSGSVNPKVGAIATIFTTVSAFIPVLRAPVSILTATAKVIKALDSLSPADDAAPPHDPRSTIAEMNSALDDLRKDIAAKEQQICDDMSALASQVEASASSFHLKRPSLADGGFGDYTAG